MAGHSKWANIKHRKAAQDAKRGKIFQKLAKEIVIAARKGSELENNSALRLIVTKARAANMPKDKIQAAINKGSGASKEIDNYQELIYEATGPNGALMVIEALTDKPTRTGPIVKNLLIKFGWSLASTNSALYAFERKGRIVIDKNILPQNEFEEIVLLTCANDFQFDDDYYVLFCEPNKIENLQNELKENNVTKFEDVVIGLFANFEVKLEEKQEASFHKLIEALDDEDDINKINHNVS